MEDVFKNELAAEKKAYMKLIGEYHYDRFCQDPGLLKKVIRHQHRKAFVEYVQSRGQGRWKYILLTVNFKEGVALELINKQVTKAFQKVYIMKYMYCYEWRKGNVGMHLHGKIWLKDGKNPYDVKREFYNTFKNVVGNKLHINTVYSNIDGCFEDYLMGKKKGEWKPNHENDVRMRLNYMMDDMYKSA